MAPIEMPELWRLQYFEPQAVDYLSPEAGGRLGAVAAGTDLWIGQWDVAKIGARRSDALRAWEAQLKATRGTFLGRDHARPYPLEYVHDGFVRMTSPDGAAPFTGAASGWSQAIDGEGVAQLTLEGLASGLILQTGDYVGFRWDSADADAGASDRRALVRVLDGKWLANGAGTITVPVAPAVPVLAVPEGATAHLDRPACVMRLTPADKRLGGIDRRLAVTGGTIAAVQDLRP
jgi:hypothetical protein